MKADSKTDPEQADNFLFQEYERLIKLRLDEVSQSEHRVDFFLTIASATAGLIIVLPQIPSL